MTTRHYLYLLLVITGAVVAAGNGIDKIWNLLPLLTAFAISETILYAGGNPWTKLPPTLTYTSVGLITGTVIVPLLYHLAWEFGIVGAKTGSMGWKMFWLIPIFAFTAGFIGGVTGFLIGNHKRKRTD